MLKFGEQTDLDGLKRVAKMLLHTDVGLTDYSPVIVQHPFTSCGIVAGEILGAEGLVDITESSENLEKWQSFMEKQIDKVKNSMALFMMINKPYAMLFVKFASPFLSRKDFSILLADTWVRSEAPNRDPNITKRQLVEMFRSADRNDLMTEEEISALDRFDDPITIFRGVTPYNENDLLALSWTLNKDKAKWFAERFGEKGKVYEAEICKQYILAFFSGRGEDEVVVDPKHLQNITLSAEQHQGGGMTLI